MAKYLKRMGAKKENFLILMKIISIDIPVKEHIRRVSIEWKRGDKKSETKNQLELTPDKTFSLVNETFSKLSVFYMNSKTGKYFKKAALMRVKGFTV